MKRVVMLIVCLVFLLGVVSATTYYVCDNGADCNAGAGSGWSTGSETNDGLSRITPFKRIQQAADIVNPGDTVIVGDGTYTDSNTYGQITDSIIILSRDGEPGNWITFKSENTHGALIDGNNGQLGYCLYLYFSDYISIEGFEIQNCNYKGIMLRSPHDVKIIGNDIHGIGRNWPDSGCTGGYSYVPGGIGSKQDTSDVTVDSNIIHDIGRMNNPACDGVTGYHSCRWDHNIYATGKFWNIKNNILYNSYCGWLLKIDDHTGVTSQPTHIVTNNVFANNVHERTALEGHILITNNHGYLSPHDVIVQNNVFYDPYEYAIEMHVNSDGSIFQNSVTSAPVLFQQVSGSGTPAILNNEVDVLLPDFGLTDPDNNDFRLTGSASHLIDRAVSNQYTPITDFDGNPRGSQPDIGAYEYSGEETTPPQTCETDSRIPELESMAQGYIDHEGWLSSIKSDAVSMYNMWPAIEGLLNLYEVSGNKIYIRYILDYCQKYENQGVHHDGDEYLDWYSSWWSFNDGYDQYHVEARAAQGCASVMAMILTDTNLTEFRAEGLALRDFIAKHVWEKWTGGYSNESWETDVIGRTARFGTIALSLYKATGDSRYLDFVITRGTELKNALRLNPDNAYYWGINFGSSNIYDTTHSQDVVNFMIESYLAGYVFDDTDMQRLVNTVRFNIWNSDMDAPLFWDCVDGVSTNCDPGKTFGYGPVGRMQTGWTKLARFDTGLQDMYYNWTRTENFYGSVYYPELSGWRNIPAFGKVGIIGGLASSICTQGSVEEPQANTDCSGLKLLMHFDTQEGYEDSSGNGNHGSCSGSSCPAWTSQGRFSGAYSFDGNDDLVTVPDSDSWDFAGKNVTVAAWFRADTAQPDTYPTFIHHFSGGLPGQGWFFGMGSTSDRVYFNHRDDTGMGGDAADIYLKTDGTYNDGVWHHTAVTIDGSVASLYVDGMLKKQDSSFGNLNDDDEVLQIGGVTESGGKFMGEMDDVAIWNRALSGQEIQDLQGGPINCGTTSACGNADSNGDKIVSITELINYIGKWKSGEKTITELIDAIGKWKSGC